MNNFVAGDTGSKLSVTCLDKDTQLAINLTGATVALKWEDDTGTVATRAMTIDTPSAGICSYQFVADELFAPSMAFEVVVTTSTGKIISNIDLINVSVRGKLA
jgi:hypothetical protein